MRFRCDSLFIEQVSERLHLCCVSVEKTAIRIGINHGSYLSESFIYMAIPPHGNVSNGICGICNDFDFPNLVLSMKASNPKIIL